MRPSRMQSAGRRSRTRRSARVAVLGLVDLVAGAAEHERDQLDDVALVVGDQHARSGARLSHCRRSSVAARARRAVPGGRGPAARWSCGPAGGPAARPGRSSPAGTLETAIVASWASMIAFTIVSPRPVPWMWRRSASPARYMRSKRRPSPPRSIPIPVSDDLERVEPVPPSTRTCDPPASRRELDRVRDQVLHHLARGGADRRRRPHALRRLQRELDPGLLGDRPRGLERARRELGEVGLPELDLERAGGDLGQQQQVADEAELAARVALDDLEEAPPLVAQVLGLDLGEELRVADDRGQRGAQLVRDEAEELVLEPLRVALGGYVATGADQPRRRRRRRPTAGPRPRSLACGRRRGSRGRRSRARSRPRAAAQPLARDLAVLGVDPLEQLLEPRWRRRSGSKPWLR